MLKVAVITDIHGNLPALKAVLKDIYARYQADRIYCLGDMEDGAPWHNEVIELIRELRIPTIMGNHDERIVQDLEVFALKKHTPEEQTARFDTIKHSKESMTEENKMFLAQLPDNIRFEYAGVSFLLVHGSPNSNNEYVFENYDDELIKDFFTQTSSDVIVCGHTHKPYIKEFAQSDKTKMYINAGSVGRPRDYCGGKAAYLAMTISDSGNVTPIIERIEYDIMETVKGIKASSVPDFYAENLLHHAQEKRATTKTAE